MAEAKVEDKVQLTRGQMERLTEAAQNQAAAEAAAPPAPEKPRVPRQIDGSRVAEASFKRTDWVATAEFGTDPKDLLDEGYFAHIASRLKPYDHVEVRVDDSRWMAELVVVESGRTWARCFMLAFHELVASNVPRSLSLPKMRVDWKGPHLQFCVIRIADNQIVADKMNNEAQAHAWIRNREQQLAS